VIQTRLHPLGAVASHGEADAVVARVFVRLPWLAALAAVLQLIAGLPWLQAKGLTSSVVLLSHVLVAMWFLANALRRHGWLRFAFAVALTGWVLNLAVMLPNGGMPVSAAARAQIGAADADVTSGQLSKHVALTDDTVLPALADVHPLRSLGMVYSAGDVILALGLVFAVGAIGLEHPASGTPRRSLRTRRRQLQLAGTHVQ